MNHKFKYLANKIGAIVIFIIFYLFVGYLQEIVKEYLPFGSWGLTSMALIINLTFGVIIGWFLLDDIKFKLNKCQNITTICTLIFFSLYQYFYYAPSISEYLNFKFFNAVKYSQLVLGIYLIFYLNRIFQTRKLRKISLKN